MSPTTLNSRAHLVSWLTKTITLIKVIPPVDEPIIQGHRDFAEVVFLEQILVPNDELDNSDLVGKGEVDGKIERGVLWIVDWIESAFDNRGLLAVIEDGDNHEAVTAG